MKMCCESWDKAKKNSTERKDIYPQRESYAVVLYFRYFG